MPPDGDVVNISPMTSDFQICEIIEESLDRFFRNFHKFFRNFQENLVRFTEER